MSAHVLPKVLLVDDHEGLLQAWHGIGLALCPKSLAIAPHVRFVLVSGDDDENTASAALRAGASEFVAKRSSGAELEKAIGRAFNAAPNDQHE